MVSVINKPFFNDFLSLAAGSQRSIKICAPFIKADVMNALYSAKKTDVRVDVLTNINLASFYRKASDISALNAVLAHDHCVTNFPHLHAKIYIFDDAELVVTSANLTSSGLKRNLEYGIYTDETELVETASKDFQIFCSDELSGCVTLEHTREISNLLSDLTLSDEPALPSLALDFSSEEDILPEHAALLVSGKLNGWSKSVFGELSKIDKQIFTTEDFEIFTPQLKVLYPQNQHIDAKIRQQLQLLRDMGLIQFVSRGVYKKLWK